jgi:hypothetical protein
MLIDMKTPPNNENIFIRQPHTKILIVLRRRPFTNISPFSSNLYKVLQAMTEMPSSRKKFHSQDRIKLLKSSLFIFFAFFSPFSSNSRENASAATEAPLVKKAISVNSPTPTSYL